MGWKHLAGENLLAQANVDVVHVLNCETHGSSPRFFIYIYFGRHQAVLINEISDICRPNF